MPSVWLVILKALPNSHSFIPTSTPPMLNSPLLYLSLVNWKIRLASVGSRLGTLGLSALSTLTVAASNSAGALPVLPLTTMPEASINRPARRVLKASMVAVVRVPLSLHSARRVISRLGFSALSPIFRAIGTVALNFLLVRSNSPLTLVNSSTLPPSL